jgi:hypothetical protein
LCAFIKVFKIQFILLATFAARTASADGRKGVQTELVADAGVGGIADGPLQVGGVLNGQQPFI